MSRVLARQGGKITEWDEAQGFGWAKAEILGQRVFVHAGDLAKGQRRPTVGMPVHYIRGIDRQGRYCAKEVTTVAVRSGGRRIKVGRDGGFLLLALLLVLPALAQPKLPWAAWIVPAVLAGMSAITFAVYAYDKRQAVARGWRVSEATLHLLEILGGWPGALLAQRGLRHKCSKASCQAAYWRIVAVYQLVAADLVLDHRISRHVGTWALQWLANAAPG